MAVESEDYGVAEKIRRIITLGKKFSSVTENLLSTKKNIYLLRKLVESILIYNFFFFFFLVLKMM